MKISICLRIKFICFVFFIKKFALIRSNLGGYFGDDIVKLFDVLLSLWIIDLSVRFNFKEILSFDKKLSKYLATFKLGNERI